MSRPRPELDVAGVLRLGEEQEAARRRRVAIAAALGLVLAAGGVALARHLLAPSLADLAGEERAGWKNAQVIAPSAEPDAAAGEEPLPFDGFAISADSEPPGAEVRVGDRLLGTTPLAVAVECAPGEPLKVRYRLPGRPVRELVTTCRASGLVRQRVEL